MTGRDKERVVWIVSEGSPGHVSQSVGLAEAVAKKIPLRVEKVECRPRLNGVGRMLVRAWMGRTGMPLPVWFLTRWLRVDLSATTVQRPDLLLCSGGKSVFAARSLAALHGAPVVFLGERKPYPSEWFHTVFTPSDRETGVNDVAIEMIPTQVSREGVERVAASWVDRPDGRLWAMVIGGASVSHRYVPADWDRLAAAMNALARAEGIRWLVTSSRRTGSEAEARLRAGLDGAAVAAAVWWAEKPEKKMGAFLGAAERVFVTQDSVTMVTESVASGRPVIVVQPEVVRFSRDSFMPGYIANLARRGRLKAVPIARLGDKGALVFECEPLTRSLSDQLADNLLARLGRGVF